MILHKFHSLFNNKKSALAESFLSGPFYRYLIYLTTALTGFSALSTQVIWQKHLEILTGSSARSLNLVVAVFLAGLAGGYYIFGLWTERKNLSRHSLLKYYGLVEGIAGIYIILFPIYFKILKKLSWSLPDYFIIDIAISTLALGLPTFLMGASIPLLTSALPENSKEVHIVQAKVYGANGLGASLGALFAGFLFIPLWGLNFSLVLMGILNIASGLVFLSNRLKGPIQKQTKPPVIATRLPDSFLILLAFFAGALSISFELIFVRILNLSIGTGAYNFPMILSIFVGGLALGSLSIKKISLRFFVRQFFIILFLLQILFLSAPYWSVWLNHILISLTPLISSYFIYQLLIFLFLITTLFPLVFFMGRILPLVYSFLKKSNTNYGKVCGWLYFFNTLGTAFGAIAISYLALYFFNIDSLFKTNIYIFFLLTLSILLYKKSLWDFIILSVLGAGLILLPSQWDRSGHEVGLFRTRSYDPKMHFKGWFFIPKKLQAGGHVSFFKDGPNSTVSLIHYAEAKKDMETSSKLKELFSTNIDPFLSYSIIVNGKSDGNSIGDFSTVFFMLPYLHSAPKKDLQTAFVGLGTGLSPGAYVPLPDVKNIEVLEISPFVVRAIKQVHPALNFHLMDSEKTQIIETDAFKYFTKIKKKFDIIISEPSNLQVLGVENLFTTEFYQLIAKSLHEDGVFGQWLYTYDLDLDSLKIVIKSIYQAFPQAKIYQVGLKDILILTGHKVLPPPSIKKFREPFVKKFYQSMGFQTVEDLSLSQILSSKEFQEVARFLESPVNSLTRPYLIYRAGRSLFLNQNNDPFELKNKFQIEKNYKEKTAKMNAFDRLKNISPEEWGKNCLRLAGFNFFCQLMHKYRISYQALQTETGLKRFQHYIFLRKRGLIPYNQQIMDDFFKFSLKQQTANLDSLSGYVAEKMKIRDYEGAIKDALTLKKNRLISPAHYQNFKADLENIRQTHQRLIEEGL